LNVNVEYEETTGVGHVPSDAITERAYARMRERPRKLYPTWVTLQSSRPDSMFNRVDWVQVYQPLRSGKEQRLGFGRAGGHMILLQSTWSVDAKIEANQIDVKTNNVQSVRFYLNDQLIDFARPVTVNVNKRARYEDFAKPSIEQMLKDQLLLGRGWRYYTAVIDIDLAPPPRARTAPTQPTTRG
jgi:hypothetical protein